MWEAFKIKESWTYLFKQKKWGIKLGIPYLINIISFILISPLVAGLIFGAALGARNQIGLAISGLSGAAIVIAVIIYFVVYVVVQYWYDYEVTQAAMQQRDIKIIYKDGWTNVFKKAGKIFLSYFIYNIPVMVIYACWYVLLLLTAGGSIFRSTNNLGFVSTSNNYTAVVLMVIIVLFLTFLIVIPYSFFVAQPAKLRMIYQGSFNEAFKLNAIYKLVKKEWKYFAAFLGIMMAYIFVYLVINFILSFLSAFPVLGLCVLPFNIVFGAVWVYFILFVMPYMAGSMYKHIAEKNNKS